MKYFLVIISAIALSSCDGVEKLDARLYDSTESTVPITKIDQLEEIDKAEKESAKGNVVVDSTKKQ